MFQIAYRRLLNAPGCFFVRTENAQRKKTVVTLKAYQELVDEGLVETRRGLGMFVNSGARNLLLRAERQKFLKEDWPRIYETILRLGLKPEELLNDNGASRRQKPKNKKEER